MSTLTAESLRKSWNRLPPSTREWDRSICPYYARYASLEGHDPTATCAFGCYDEPSCITDEPIENWPAIARLAPAQPVEAEETPPAVRENMRAEIPTPHEEP